ncbi:MAG: hypothetical protein Q8L47_02860 [bacterium]|nr:hypothetical protein [bacterium]
MKIYEQILKLSKNKIAVDFFILASILIASTTFAQTPVPLPVVSLHLDRAEIKNGENTTLTWSSSHANRCSGSGSWFGYQATSGSIVIWPKYSTYYKLTCWNTSGKSNSDSISITVNPIPYPTVTLTASSTSIKSGDSTLIKWSSTNADYCTASGGWTGNWQPTGAVSVSPIKNTSYTITCINSLYKVSKSLYIYIRGVSSTNTTSTSPIDVVITAFPQTILKGQSTKLSWGASNVSSCYGSGAWTGSKLPYDTQIVSPKTSSVYELTCAKRTEVKSSSILVIVSDTLQTTTTPNAYSPTLIFRASPTIVATKGTTVLNWQSNNANYCIAGGGWTGYKTANGSESFTINMQNNFTLTCYGSNGASVFAEALVSITSSNYSSIKPTTIPNIPSLPTPSFIATCAVSNITAKIGEQIAWSAVASGGTSPYSYIWSGAISKVGANNSVAFNSIGTKTAMVTISDRLGRTSRATCSTFIKPRIITSTPLQSLPISTVSPSKTNTPSGEVLSIMGTCSLKTVLVCSDGKVYNTNDTGKIANTESDSNIVSNDPSTTPTSSLESDGGISKATSSSLATLFYNKEGELSGFGLLIIVYFLVLLFIAFAVLVYRFLKTK